MAWPTQSVLYLRFHGSLSSHRSRRRERTRSARQPLRRQAFRGGTPPLPEYPGPRTGRALLGHPAPVARDPARHQCRRPRTQTHAGRHRHRYLGRGLRTAGLRRPADRYPAPLPRRAHQRRDGQAFRSGAARPGFRLHRHTVHAAQHAVSVVCHAPLRIEAAPRGTLLGKRIEPPYAPVYATAGHDTAAAVVAVPAESGDNWCYISSGTWSLMGLELDRPVINAQSLAANYTNEVGVSGNIRFLKNIAGLWLLQECRKAWMLEG